MTAPIPIAMADTCLQCAEFEAECCRGSADGPCGAFSQAGQAGQAGQMACSPATADGVADDSGAAVGAAMPRAAFDPDTGDLQDCSHDGSGPPLPEPSADRTEAGGASPCVAGPAGRSPHTPQPAGEPSPMVRLAVTMFHWLIHHTPSIAGTDASGERAVFAPLRESGEVFAPLDEAFAPQDGSEKVFAPHEGGAKGACPVPIDTGYREVDLTVKEAADALGVRSPGTVTKRLRRCATWLVDEVGPLLPASDTAYNTAQQLLASIETLARLAAWDRATALRFVADHLAVVNDAAALDPMRNARKRFAHETPTNDRNEATHGRAAG